MKIDTSLQKQPVIPRLEDFDKSSGNLLERALYNHRLLVIIICALLTLFLGYEVTKLKINAGFDKMLPYKSPYIINYLKYRDQLKGLGNAVRIIVATNQGTICDKNYLQILQNISDEVFLVPGVDRTQMKSLWTPATRWLAITEEGLAGGQVIPDDYDGTPETISKVRINIERSGEVGRLVAADYKSSVIYAPLLEIDTETGKPLDYHKLSAALEQLRNKYNNDTIQLHITGFAKIVGDLIDGLKWFILFFVIAIVIDLGLLLWYIRCTRSTCLIVVCSLVAVLWCMGLLPFLGMELDPYSVLVPFLVFAVGMSHASQQMNGIMQDIGRGNHPLVAARYTFRRIFLAGAMAVLTDALGFTVLLLIPIKIIQDLALTASIGVLMVLVTNLILVPILLTYTGVSAKAAERSLTEQAAGSEKHFAWKFLDLFTQRKWAAVAIVCFLVASGVGIYMSKGLCIGDLGRGAPELRENSRYNQDNAYMVSHYAASSDLFVVFATTPPNEGILYKNMMKMAALGTELRQLPGVDSINSLAAMSKIFMVGMTEGNPNWYEVLRSQGMLNAFPSRVTLTYLYNELCNVLPILVFLKDHKADTLTSVLEKAEEFGRKHSTEELKFYLAAGNAGIEAATNIAVKKAMRKMLFIIYGSVILLCFVTFRSWRAVCLAVIPLAGTSLLCQALMVALGIGVKVATMPVIALGVGIGVDYALYILSVLLARMKAGLSLSDAYYETLCSTGRIVVLTGLTLAVGVATWAFAPIKFQADMGILLVFMFLWNMVGALIMIPALGCFILKQEKKVS